MRTEELPWWLHGIDIIGFEEDDNSDNDDDGEDESEEEDEENRSGDSDEDEDDEGEDDDEEEPDPTEGLKSALRKERMARKKAERELRKLKKNTSTKPKPKDSENEDEDDGQSSEELEAERKRTERLATRLRDQAIDNLIRKYATNFADPEDAVSLVNRALIEVDQDDEDPSEIEVDEDSVKDAVKALAKKKKHLLASNAGNGTKSGSKFSGKKGGSKKEISDEELRAKYAALRR